jgi:leukotriene A-4 hydrolase/aminopeptidase
MSSVTSASTMIKSASDLATLSTPDSIRQKHYFLKLTADFEKKILVGSTTITFVVLKENASVVTVDTNQLNIKGVSMNGSMLQWNLGDFVEPFGKALSITLPKVYPVNSELEIKIEYETTKKSGALQWLPPAQTDGKVHPFLFSQCQAIHARSMMPCQDTCGAKCTYEANITVPKALTAIMSARGNGNPSQPVITDDTNNDSGVDMHTFSFHQPVACATYLVALAVGDLKFKSTGERTGVWAETNVVDKAAYEFDGMEAMVDAGESICGPYVWGRYDVLCMPPSFPYGGMENPCLTFVTPTLLAGDRSLADVVIHEITHSWTGNLVTNSSWKHFWLNEGWTMFIQRKIVSKIHNHQTAELDASLRLKSLKDTVKMFGPKHNFTRLCPDLENVDPDDAFSIIPYEKGFHLLRYLEDVVGGAANFAPFVKAYIKEYAHKTLNSHEFKNFYLSFFTDVPNTAQINWDEWFRGTGMPPVDNKFDDSLAQDVVKLKNTWLKTRGENCSSNDIKNWIAMQTMYFLDLLQGDDAKVINKSPELLGKMDVVYGFTQSGNSEIRFRWQVLCLRAGVREIIPHVVKLATEQGRMKFTRPLYRELFKTEFGKEIAIETFKLNYKLYHPICAKMVARDLGL